MSKPLKLLAVWADSISVVSFLFWLFASLPFIGTAIVDFLSHLPFALRMVVVGIFEIAIAYTLGALVRRLIENKGLPISNLPSQLTIIAVVSLFLSLASIYNMARILFLDNFAVLWEYLLIFTLQFFVLWLRGLLLRSNLSAIRSFANEAAMIQRVFAVATGVVVLSFLIERWLLG